MFHTSLTTFNRRHILHAMATGAMAVVLHGASVCFAGAGSQLRENMVERERQKLAAQRDAW